MRATPLHSRFGLEIHDAATLPGTVYTHAWRPGNVLIWDERAMLHRGRPSPYEEERTLASICVSACGVDGLNRVRRET